MRFIDRVFGLFIAAGFVIVIFGLSLEWILVKGPSPSLRDSFTTTMQWTRRFDFIPTIFLTPEEANEIFMKHWVTEDEKQNTDASLITVAAQEVDPDLGPQPDAYGLIDEDGDGIIICDVKKKGFVGKMIVVLDPSRVFVGKPEVYGGYGLLLEDYVKTYNAIGGINGGGFFDASGGGTGGYPDGLTIVDGVVYGDGNYNRTSAGFDRNNILHVGYYDTEYAQQIGIRDCVSFGPALIINGQGEYGDYMESGINPRTAIGQRADGAVLLLCIDGRQIHSIGASFGDARDVMLDFGAVNACNMDGGSSSVMYYNGEYINSPSSASGTSRNLPNAFLFK
ncbi:MAG: phosphodiester glycosidase family protein [Oscillospiraceae bacterium]|nr:phosphodiester glycosidase family protein [Oscillospiraceae bacterium]